MAPENDISDYWNHRANDTGLEENEVTHPDVWQRWLELELVRPWLRPRDRLIDAGCGNGWATRMLAPAVAEAVGIDVVPAMIDRACKSPDTPPSNVAFYVLDTLDLTPDSFGRFDVALSQRHLINLPDVQAQRRAVSNLRAVLNAGGRLILAEGWREGRQALNALRVSHGLKAMPDVHYNLDIAGSEFTLFETAGFKLLEKRTIGVYDLISRVVHPLLVAPDSPSYTAKINEIAAALALDRRDCEEISRVMFMVLERVD